MWGNNANCYAYACKCKTPAIGIRGAAVPGGYAKMGVYAGDDEIQYKKRLISGIVADCTKNDMNLIDISLDITQFPDQKSGYIIAMVANKAGFHFFRRDRTTKLWSWKSGNNGKEDSKIFKTGGVNKSIKMDDEAFVESVDTQQAMYVGSSSQGMEFYAYLGIPNINGLTVSGIANEAEAMPVR